MYNHNNSSKIMCWEYSFFFIIGKKRQEKSSEDACIDLINVLRRFCLKFYTPKKKKKKHPGAWYKKIKFWWVPGQLIGK
jgi:hypothetical protein